MSPHADIALLVLNPQPKSSLERIARHYRVIYAPTPARRSLAIAQGRDTIRAVLTIGTLGLTAAEIAALPRLELICALGVGYEAIDIDAARARGIALANGAGTNARCVADHAIGLLIAAVRGFTRLDRACRAGRFRDDIAMPAGITGRRLGILGLGEIGRQVARRAAAFDMSIGYHSRRQQPDQPFRYFTDLMSLAGWSDVLLLAAPGGAQTRHCVNAEVLRALGPQGVLVNIARGSLVDTAALAAALADGTIAGAGLDVYESEPQPPTELIGFDNLVITPHLAGWSAEAVEATVERFLANADGHFTGRGVVSPI